MQDEKTLSIETTISGVRDYLAKLKKARKIPADYNVDRLIKKLNSAFDKGKKEFDKHFSGYSPSDLNNLLKFHFLSEKHDMVEESSENEKIDTEFLNGIKNTLNDYMNLPFEEKIEKITYELLMRDKNLLPIQTDNELTFISLNDPFGSSQFSEVNQDNVGDEPNDGEEVKFG